MKKFLTGSTLFFSCYDDFSSKDVDEIELVDVDVPFKTKQLSGKGRCLFQIRRLPSTEDYISQALLSKSGMIVGRFLTPDFCKEIGFTIKDLEKVEPLLDRLDPKHEYEKIIYYSYINNNSFTLTDAQRDKAYASYRASRR